MNRANSIPAGRGARLWQLSRLAGGLALGAAAEGARTLAGGRLPSPGDLLLTPANAQRVTERLSELRGAAMKVGQLLSLEAGDLLPVELTAILARLRMDAHQMPLGEVAAVLEQAWGADWPGRFSRFSFTPLAAASIGQVHEALDRDGRRLAIKVQYPGVRESIDSDVDNVARLLKLVRAVPEELDLDVLLAEAKRQLHEEADYLREAEHLQQFGRLLADAEAFEVPLVDAGWTTPQVLVMSFVEGDALEALETESMALRQRVGGDLLYLALREVFEWGLVQTDPNFANYRFRRAGGRLGLLDFGAVRHYPPHRVESLRQLMKALLYGNDDDLLRAACAAGYLRPDDATPYRDAVLDLLRDAGEPIRRPGMYDFAASDLAPRMSAKVVDMRLRGHRWRLPPPDLLFLHRKLGGLYMLLARLRLRLDVHELAAGFAD